MTDADKGEWRKLCGIAVQLCGSQEKFRKESAILKRLVKRYGAADVERMLRGAQLKCWNSLVGLGGKDGVGARWALEVYWAHEKATNRKAPESLRSIFKGWGK